MLTITYTGEPVRVDMSKYDALDPETREEELDNYVPMVGDLGGQPGQEAATLFANARDAGILVQPEGLDIQCYGDDDPSDGTGGMVLVAYPRDGLASRIGVTGGWRDADNVAGDETPGHARELVEHALDFFAAELNLALGVNAHA